MCQLWCLEEKEKVIMFVLEVAKKKKKGQGKQLLFDFLITVLLPTTGIRRKTSTNTFYFMSFCSLLGDEWFVSVCQCYPVFDE